MFFQSKTSKLLWVFMLGLEIWPRHAHFPRFQGAETEGLDLQDQDFEKYYLETETCLKTLQPCFLQLKMACQSTKNYGVLLSIRRQLYFGIFATRVRACSCSSHARTH